jgi:hypothetical protein
VPLPTGALVATGGLVAASVGEDFAAVAVAPIGVAGGLVGWAVATTWGTLVAAGAAGAAGFAVATGGRPAACVGAVGAGGVTFGMVVGATVGRALTTSGVG